MKYRLKQEFTEGEAAKLVEALDNGENQLFYVHKLLFEPIPEPLEKLSPKDFSGTFDIKLDVDGEPDCKDCRLDDAAMLSLHKKCCDLYEVGGWEVSERIEGEIKDFLCTLIKNNHKNHFNDLPRDARQLH